MHATLSQYKAEIQPCKTIFLQKTADYGTAWEILRLPSLTDQIFIKLNRIRSIEEQKLQKVSDPIRDEYQGIINYCVIALLKIQSYVVKYSQKNVNIEDLEQAYNQIIEQNIALMEAKNHDYGEAWREMRVSSLTDLMLMKIYRIKSIEDNLGKTIASEGIDANYMDILNYAAFALIRLAENCPK